MRVGLLVIILIFMIGCKTQKSVFRAKQVLCLRTLIQGEDSGGIWQFVSGTGASVFPTIQTAGDNVCLESNNLACGNYTFRYIVGDICCRDSTEIVVKKCCVTGTSTCN